MINRALKLPLRFDPEQLRQDFAYCLTRPWTSHFNTADYAGSWTSLSLRSASGRETDILAHDGPESYHDTPVLAHCPYFRAILAQVRAPLQAVRLLSLGPGSRIREHTDRQTAYEYGCFRLHVPLQTGASVQFRVGGAELPMQVGECWYANFHLPHSVRNDGPTDRIHLIIDGLRNAWSDDLFGRAGYDFAHEANVLAPSVATKQQMLAELDRLNTDAARQLAAQLRHDLSRLIPTDA